MEFRFFPMHIILCIQLYIVLFSLCVIKMFSSYWTFLHNILHNCHVLFTLWIYLNLHDHWTLRCFTDFLLYHILQWTSVCRCTSEILQVRFQTLQKSKCHNKASNTNSRNLFACEGSFLQMVKKSSIGQAQYNEGQYDEACLDIQFLSTFQVISTG